LGASTGAFITNPTKLGGGDFASSFGTITPIAVPATAANVTTLTARKMFDWRWVSRKLAIMSVRWKDTPVRVGTNLG
jgi:hypothetical protein